MMVSGAGARTAVRNALSLLDGRVAALPEITSAVLRLSSERLAWNGRRDLGGDVVLDQLVVDDELLTSLAESLWITRHQEQST